MRCLILLFVPLLLVAQDTPESLDALAAQYRSAGRLADADGVLDRLVEIAPSVASIEKSARVKSALGQWARAEELYNRALGVC